MDIPRDDIARAREAADAIELEDDEPMEDEPQPEVDNADDVDVEQDNAPTIAEPEGEGDIDMDEEDEGEGEEQIQEVQSRTPVLVFGTDLHIDPQLAHYQEGTSGADISFV